MSRGKFSRAAESLVGSPLVIPLFLVFVAMFIVSLVTSVEDYTTSRLGYMALPTRKASPAVIWAVAAIPQLGQIGFAYAWGREWKTNRRMAFVSLIVAVGLHVVDVGTDMVYKAGGQGIEVWGIAFLESELLFTLGSEIMFTVSLGMIITMFPEFMGQIAMIGHKLTDILDKIDGDQDDDDLGDLGLDYGTVDDW